MPSLLRIASASLSGSPGMSGPLVPGAGLVFRNTRIHSSICFFKFVFVDESVNLHGAEEVADAFADAAAWDFLPERRGPRERRRGRPPLLRLRPYRAVMRPSYKKGAVGLGPRSRRLPLLSFVMGKF